MPLNYIHCLLFFKAGFLIDHRKHHPIILQLLFLSSVLTMSAYLWFVLNPTWTKTPVPGIISFAMGHGFSPCKLCLSLANAPISLHLAFYGFIQILVLLVVLVPKIVASKYISTALGAHKSVCQPTMSPIPAADLSTQMEQTGSTIFQTLAGIWLDSGNEKTLGNSVLQKLLNSFLALNVLEFCVVLLLACIQHRKNLKINRDQSHLQSNSSHQPSRLDASSHQDQPQTLTQDTPLLDPSSHLRQYTSDSNLSAFSLRHDRRKNESENRRGLLMSFLCAALLLAAWILFMITAWYKLGHKKGIH